MTPGSATLTVLAFCGRSDFLAVARGGRDVSSLLRLVGPSVGAVPMTNVPMMVIGQMAPWIQPLAAAMLTVPCITGLPQGEGEGTMARRQA